MTSKNSSSSDCFLERRDFVGSNLEKSHTTHTPAEGGAGDDVWENFEMTAHIPVIYNILTGSTVKP
jgi:hypothetical protein